MAVENAYNGLVPISPNTTPKAKTAKNADEPGLFLTFIESLDTPTPHPR
jgi:hypothetical protein